MTDFDQESASRTSTPLGDDLPPVQPPSAGFIVQLFVFPALIVMGVVAIWWMFGYIASGEQDWHKLLQELQSQNLLIRNRAMYGLAQVLDQDSRRGEMGHNLRANREIAQGMADQLILELRKNSTSKEALAIEEYLTRALGMLDALDVTAPALRMALEPQRDLRIRESAVVSVSFVAGRANERQQPLDDAGMVEALIELSGDPAPVLRQVSAFALGLFQSPEAIHQLEVLLANGDRMTRVNAAIGLSRHGSTAGYAVILDAVKLTPARPSSPTPPIPSLTPATPSPTPAAPSSPQPGAGPDLSTAEGEQFLVLKNVLKAVAELAPKFTEAQRQELMPELERLSSRHAELRIRIDAAAAVNALKAVSN